MIDWQEIYKKFLLERKTDKLEEVAHRHHIVPRYEQGSNEESNLVRLSIEDHATAHWLRYKWLGKQQDKVAWLMLSGKTEKGELERKKLCLLGYPIEKRREFFVENNPMHIPENVEKSLETKRQRYGGNYHSQEGLASLRESCRSGKQHTPKAKQKRIKSLKETRQNMSDEEYYEKYVKNHTGESGSMYGKKRPGELSGNYGTSKGTYKLISPKGEVLEFKGITKLMKFGVGETLIRNWRNRGKIAPQPNYKRSSWAGYEIQYEPNTSYGKTNKHVQKVKRKQQQKPN